MPETYTPITFVNDSAPALNATNLNITQTGIKTIDTRVAKLELGVDTPVPVTYAASLAINATQGSLFRINASGNLTITDITGGTDGQQITIEVLALTADRTLSFSSGSPASVVIPVGQIWTESFRYRSATDSWVFDGTGGGGSTYTDEQAQDAAAALLTSGVHTGVIATYVDASNRVDLVVTGGGSGTDQLAQNVAKAPYVAVDTFTRSDGAIGSAETGQAWTVAGGALTVASGKATASTTTTANIEVSRSNVDVQCLVTPASGTSTGVIFRSAATEADLLMLVADVANGFRLNKRDTSTTSILATTPFTFVPGTAYLIRVVMFGDVITGYLNGVQQLAYTLTTAEQTKYNALTRVGVRTSGTGAVTWEDFVVRDVVTGAGSGAVDFTAGMIANAGPFMNAMGMRHTIYYNSTTSSWPARTVPSGFTGGVIWDSMGDTSATQPAGMIEGDFWDRRAA